MFLVSHVEAYGKKVWLQNPDWWAYLPISKVVYLGQVWVWIPYSTKKSYLLDWIGCSFTMWFQLNVQQYASKQVLRCFINDNCQQFQIIHLPWWQLAFSPSISSKSELCLIRPLMSCSCPLLMLQAHLFSKNTIVIANIMWQLLQSKE